MSLKEKLDQDIRQFFDEIEDMLPEGKRKSLRLLMDRYYHLTSTPIKFDKSDFDMIKQHATRDFVNNSFPKKFRNSYQIINTDEALNFCLTRAVISYLNAKDCLKKLPKFDIEGE